MPAKDKSAEEFYQFSEVFQSFPKEHELNYNSEYRSGFWWNCLAKKIVESLTTGRPSHNFKQVSGPTTYAKRNIISGKTKTAFSVIIDNNIISYTKNVREQSVMGSRD